MYKSSTSLVVYSYFIFFNAAVNRVAFLISFSDLLLVYRNTTKYFLKNKFIYFWLHWVFVAVHRLLTAVASLVAEHRL